MLTVTVSLKVNDTNNAREAALAFLECLTSVSSLGLSVTEPGETPVWVELSSKDIGAALIAGDMPIHPNTEATLREVETALERAETFILDRPACHGREATLRDVQRAMAAARVPRCRSQTPAVDLVKMGLSDGRADYWVRIKVGDRDVTPHVFREEYKAAYHVALYRWLLCGGDKPDLVAFDPTDWPAVPSIAPDASALMLAALRGVMIDNCADDDGETVALLLKRERYLAVAAAIAAAEGREG